MKTFSMIISLILMVTEAFATESVRQGLLIGGGLKICSSFAPDNCTSKPKFSHQALSEKLFQSNAVRLTATKKQWQQSFSQPMPAELLVLLERFNRRYANQVFNRKTLTQKLQSINISATVSGSDVITDLNDPQWYFLLDHYQLPRVDRQGRSLEEALDLTQSDPASVAIVEQFITMSRQVARSKGKNQTTILVSTASAGDVFDAVSFYTQLFKKADINVYWLPIEAALNTVWHKKQSCEQLPQYRARISRVYDRQRVYPNLARFQQKLCEQPELFKQLIVNADGLFFNGGDQTLTLQSLATIDASGTYPSPLYTKIKSHFDGGELVLAGSSAGTAVMGGGRKSDKPIPMINNGASLYGLVHGAKPKVIPPAACGGELGCDLDELSFLPSGGFDFFSIGVFDTHFSERNRQYRLARLLNDTQSLYGIGIDENTALHITVKDKETRVKTIGQGHAWLFKNQYASTRSINVQEKDTKTLGFSLAVLGKNSLGIFEQGQNKWRFNNPLSPDNHAWGSLRGDVENKTQGLKFSLAQNSYEAVTTIKKSEPNKDWPYWVEISTLQH